MGPMYQFHKNDVVQNMILTENLLGTVEYIHTGSDELTDIIDIEESSDEEPPPWNDETGLQLADLPKIPRITIPVNLPIEHCKPSLYARQISPQEPPPGYNEIRLQPEDPPKIQRNIIPVDQSIQQCQPSLYARQISPQIERDIGDFWMGKHYMCIGRDASSQCRTVLVDVCFINKQVPPPPGFTLIGTTDLHNLEMCYKMSKIRTLLFTKTSVTHPWENFSFWEQLGFRFVLLNHVTTYFWHANRILS
ncbi:hypothetical protein MAR_005383 [Mya arenaria]|uniref:Uncharacterized protein n=1 Tax=Mya arenaria TaxID=6604 RepID=A0ABY7F3I7_MYAAR|nr:hypothetical protein MAR_005383 [Mya arenaria]